MKICPACEILVPILTNASINCPSLCSGAIHINSGLSFHLYPYIVHADSKGSGESAHLHMLA